MAKRQSERIEKILSEKPDLSYRDARDLAMEYGATSIEADGLAAGRR